ncbi:hypothetical protein NDU88_001710 [Pleurodeles waltl]|uniref:Uncharacterized protein n=1 Tax=Pleurodeles waltl TaxID=8319 RepID=A0AAV7T007_PLEWA|nr:hypothetical protein NDU88_001710 [Pleurodeles waltl]
MLDGRLTLELRATPELLQLFPAEDLIMESLFYTNFTAEAAGDRIPPLPAVFLSPYYDISAGPADGNSVTVHWPSGNVTSTLQPARNRAGGNADVQRVQ